jgi:hypothetical protein
VQWIERDAEGRETVYRDEPNTSWVATLFNWVVAALVDEELL